MSAPPVNVDDLVAAYHDLQARKADIEEQQEQIKAQLRSHLQVGKHQLTTGTVTVSVNRRFNETRAREVLPPEVIAAATAPKLDTSLVRKLISPVQYEACMTEVGDPKVVVS